MKGIHVVNINLHFPRELITERTFQGYLLWNEPFKVIFFKGTNLLRLSLKERTF